MSYSIKRVLLGALVPAVLTCGLLAATADARISLAQAKQTATAYNNVGMRESDKHSSEHRMSARPEWTYYKREGTRFHVWWDWKLARDGDAGAYTRDVMVNIIVSGNGTQACVRRRHNANPNADPPSLQWVGTYFFVRKVLRWEFDC